MLCYNRSAPSLFPCSQGHHHHHHHQRPKLAGPHPDRTLPARSREDVNPATTSGAPVNRRFVLPLGGSVIAYHKTVMPFSFSVQIFSAGELKNEFILAAASEPIMNVWMEVLYVSTGKELPGLEDEEGAVALDVDTKLDEINSGATPQPSRRYTASSLPGSSKAMLPHVP